MVNAKAVTGIAGVGFATRDNIVGQHRLGFIKLFEDTELQAEAPYEFLNERHPVWLEQIVKWRDRTRLYFGDVETQHGKKHFLPRGAREAESLYCKRIDLSEVVPSSAPALKRVTNTVFSEDVVRRWGVPPKKEVNADGDEKKRKRSRPREERKNRDLNELERNVDGRHTDATQFMKMIARRVAALGVYHVLVDRPALPEGTQKPKTVAEERELGIRLPTFVALSPLQVVNWRTDRQGNLLWVVIRTMYNDVTEQVEDLDQKEQARIIVEYTRWTRTDWTRWTFEVDTEAVKLVALASPKTSGKHDLGVVPLAQIYFEPTDEPMKSSSLSDEAFRVDLIKIRAESHLNWDAYVHAHPELVIWTRRPLKEIGLGTNTYLKLNPDAREEVRYISPEANSYEVNKWIIQRGTEDVVRHQGIDPLGVLLDKKVRMPSGVSRAWSFKTSEERTLISFAKSLQAGETTIWEIAARWISPNKRPASARVFEAEFYGVIQYSMKFDIQAPTERLQDFAQLRRQIKSQTLLRKVAESIALQLSWNLTADETDAVVDEINELDFTKSDSLGVEEDEEAALTDLADELEGGDEDEEDKKIDKTVKPKNKKGAPKTGAP